jgi:hypothetical protein
MFRDTDASISVLPTLMPVVGGENRRQQSLGISLNILHQFTSSFLPSKQPLDKNTSDKTKGTTRATTDISG